MSDLTSKAEHLLMQKFGSLTKIQALALPIVSSGTNVLISAPTGFGKTEAALTPILIRLSQERLPAISCIYITPLRALNRDLLKRLSEWCAELGISIAVRHGDTPPKERGAQLRAPPHLLITTPETFQAILCAKKFRAHLANVKFVIVDEIHELLDNKRGAQLAVGLERLAEVANFQRIGLSATISDKKLTSEFLCGARSCEIVSIDTMREMVLDVVCPTPEEKDAALGHALYIDAAAAARLRTVVDIVRGARKVLIFTNTRAMAEILGSRAIRLMPAAVHHGSLSRDARIAIESQFKHGELSALIATSSLELGIDIGDVEHVIQYSSPRQATRLVQRIGRSAHTEHGVQRGTIIAIDLDDLLEAHAIVDFVKRGRLERTELCECALDVLAHQVAGIALLGDRSVNEIFKIVSRARPYKMLSFDELCSVIKFLNEKGIVRIRGKGRCTDEGVLTEDDVVRRTALTRPYYYKNLSTIPSVKKFAMRDAATNLIISHLDESFVVPLERGDLLITKGLPWRVLDINPSAAEIIVEQSEDLFAAIPDWEGEEIPTSYEIAQAVGELKTRLDELSKTSLPQLQQFKNIIRETKIVPTNKLILIEGEGNAIVLHVHGGLKANRTIAALFAYHLASTFGASLKTFVDPYRIAFLIPTQVTEKDLENVVAYFEKFAKSDIALELKLILPLQKLFVHKFHHVAKAFGLIGDGERISQRFISILANTPVFTEALRDVLHSYYDLERAKEIFEKIKNGEVFVKTTLGLSPLATLAFSKWRGSELIAPAEPSSEIVKAFAKRILSKKLLVLCTYCGNTRSVVCGDLEEMPKCHRCGSSMLSPAKDEDIKLFKKSKLTKEESKRKRELLKCAAVVAAAGKRGIIALATYGVGPESSAQALKHRKLDEVFFSTLLELQKRFIRTRQYWEPHKF